MVSRIPVPDMKAFGIEVARLRRERGLTIDALAGLAQVDRKTVIAVEAGRKVARLNTAHSLAHALEVPLSELVRPICARHPRAVRQYGTEEPDDEPDTQM